MDQFLPADISVMVLRFLASSGCESSVVSMIEEMPVLQLYLPKQPPGLSKTDFVRMLGRPSHNPSLNHVLNDYGEAKMLVTDIVGKRKSSRSPVHHCDSLLTQVKILSQIISEMTKEISPPKSVLLEEKAINTDACPIFEAPQVAIAAAKVTTDAETQTVELPIIEIGNGDSADVPMLFYNSLMSNSNLPQKLAMAINEHLTDTSTTRNEALQKVCSSAETEIDNFFVDLLQDEPPSADMDDFPSLSGLISDKVDEPQNSVFNEVERNLTSLFHDAHSFIEDPLLISKTSIQKKTEQVGVSVQSDDSKSLEDSNTQNEDKIMPSTATNKNVNLQAKRIPKKRIKPTPVVQTDVNPVFDKVSEPAVSAAGQHYSVHKNVPVVSAVSNWEMLGRRSILPKIPSSKSSSATKVVPDTDRNQPVVSVNKRKARLSTPIKLTPEKAKSTDFFLVCHDTPKVGPSSTTKSNVQPNNLDSCANKMEVVEPPEPMPVSELQINNIQTPAEKLDQVLSSVTGSTVEVTPILDVPNFNFPSSSVAQSVSPRLRRLVVSAQKVRASSTQANIVRKSYSTPRKKKHVRSLLFNTPPSLKNKGIKSPDSPSSKKVENEPGVSVVLPVKRKLSPKDDSQPRIKRQLMWMEQETTYKSSAFPDRNFSQTRVSEKMVSSANKVLQSDSYVDNKPIAEKDDIVRRTRSCSRTPKPLPQIPEETLSVGANSRTAVVPALSALSIDPVITPQRSKTITNCKEQNSTPVIQKPSPVVGLDTLTKKSATVLPEKQTLRDSKPPSVDEECDASKAKGPNTSQSLMTELFGSENSTEDDNSPILNNARKRSSNKNEKKKSPTLSSDTKQKRTRQPRKESSSAKKSTPRKSPIKTIKTAELAVKKNLSPQKKSTTREPRKSPKPKISSTDSPKPKRSRKSKRELEAEEAHAVVSDAVALGKSPRKQTRNRNVSNKSTLKNTEVVKTVPEIVVAPVEVTEIVTPLKHPFNISPALGFPDPTPTKVPVVHQPKLQVVSSSPLVTPMKSHSSASISPPILLPPTPRYLVNETDTDSNSTGMFKITDGIYPSSFINSTPSKFLEPPATPGRNLFLENENSEENIPTGYVHYTVPSSDNRTTTDPTLHCTSPIVPHRIASQPSVSSDTIESKLNSSPEKKESPVAGLYKKLAAWKAKSSKPKNVEFQIPKGAPKKVSPLNLNTVKKVSDESTFIANNLFPASKSRSSRNSIHETPNGSSGGMKFVVGGTTKSLSMSEHQTLLGLLEIGKGRNSDPKQLTTSDSPSQANKTEGLHQGRSSLKNVDLNHFLHNVLHKISDSGTAT